MMGINQISNQRLLTVTPYKTPSGTEVNTREPKRVQGSGTTSCVASGVFVLATVHILIDVDGGFLTFTDKDDTEIMKMKTDHVGTWSFDFPFTNGLKAVTTGFDGGELWVSWK